MVLLIGVNFAGRMREMIIVDVYTRQSENAVKKALDAARKICSQCGKNDICTSTPNVCDTNFSLKSTGNVYDIGKMRVARVRAEVLKFSQKDQG